MGAALVAFEMPNHGHCAALLLPLTPTLHGRQTRCTDMEQFRQNNSVRVASYFDTVDLSAKGLVQALVGPYSFPRPLMTSTC